MMTENKNNQPNMADSGVGSFGSESDSSPGASSFSKTPHLPVTTDQATASENTGNEKSIDKAFCVGYFGYIEIDKRYIQQQFWKVILQWIVAEIKRTFDKKPVDLKVKGSCLIGCDTGDGSTLINHDVHQISRFSRTHLDTTCFAYVTKGKEQSFLCHVFKTEDENIVKEIFSEIREATKVGAKDAVFQNVTKNITAHQADQENNHLSLYEVLYIGKVVVSGKKTRPTFIDDAVDKFKMFEIQKAEELEDRRRRSSGKSVQSLPGNLEQNVAVTENELHMSEKSDAQNQSNDSVSSTTSDHDVSTSSAETIPHELEHEILPKQIHTSNSEGSIENMQQENADYQEKGFVKYGGNLQRNVLESQTYGKKNRTMLLQISKSEVSLISPDRKRTSLKRNFKDISFCSQGILHPDYFGFITRDVITHENETPSFLCFVFMCAAESVVEDVMQTLKISFDAAFQQSAKTHTCELCPMHQLQKVGEEIDKKPWEQIIEILKRRVDQLSEADQEEFQKKYMEEAPESYQASAEVSMMILRYMCEDRQLSHVHISDANKNLITKYEFTLSEGAKNRFSAFDELRSRAKKSLTESFEVFKERVRHKSGDALKTMRDKSLDSEPGDTESHSQMANQITSPTSMLKGFFFPTSPPNVPPSDHVLPVIKSPTQFDHDGRPRSSTNPSLLQKMRDRHRSIPESDGPLSPQPQGAEIEMLSMDKLNQVLNDDGDSNATTLKAEGDGEEHAEERGQEEEDGENKLAEEMQEDGEVKTDKTELPRFESPLRTMFLKAGNKDTRTPSPNTASTKTSNSKPPLRRAGSWRLNILNRVVTPAKIPTRSHSAREASVHSEEDPLPPPQPLSDKALDRKISSQRCRMLWKKAILETLLFIRMKKEMKSLQTRHDEQSGGAACPQKLEYDEITPCLKQVTKVWTQMLCTPHRTSHKFDYRAIEQAVKDGVPRAKRGGIWQLLVEQHRMHHHVLGHVTELNTPYEHLLKQLTTHQHAILIDLGRTFPSHPYFSTQLGQGQLSLFNILKAYSLLDKEVGYCQGLSFVAGILLMHMPESMAFDVLRYMMFALGFRRQYRPDMVALQIQMYQLSRLLHDQHRDLYDHFEQYEIAPTLYAAPWFLTMFASQFPIGFVARVFDVIFLQGSMDVVLKVVLVVLGNHKELIKNCTSFESIVRFLKSDLPEMGIIQMERVVNQVFALDISKQLHAYEVEYHVLREEMVTTPQRGETDVIARLETANHNLKKQNLELLEQLQAAHSHNHSIDVQVNKLHTNCGKLKKHMRTLEIERDALLSTMARIQSCVDPEILKTAGIVIPNIPSRPLAGPPASQHTNGSGDTFMSALDSEVAHLMSDMNSANQERPQPRQRMRRPSSSEN